MKQHKHQYQTDMSFLSGAEFCKHCGLLKSTITANEEEISTKLADKKDLLDKLMYYVEKECEVFDQRSKKERHLHPDGECYLNDVIGVAQEAIKDAEETLLIKILAEMESVATAKECRHIIKEYILKEK